jgi:hypothetical protein
MSIFTAKDFEMGIAENLAEITKRIPQGVKLVAVSKTKSADDIMEAYNAGHKIFGENKVQELTAKSDRLPKDIEWHFIGHLQTNKVKYIAPFVNMIHAVDSLKLLKIINSEAAKNNRIIPCLLQFHIAEEASKFGLAIPDAKKILESEAFRQMKNITICGVMGMATFTDDDSQISSEFRTLKSIFEIIKKEHFGSAGNFNEISMGMSDDYLLAINEGSTIVRVGSKIFGARNY